MIKPTFDIDAALKALQEGKDLTGKDGILTPLIKQLTEAVMQAELDNHLAEEAMPNPKNGTTRKTVKGATSSFELKTPRDPVAPSSPSLSKNTRRI